MKKILCVETTAGLKEKLKKDFGEQILFSNKKIQDFKKRDFQKFENVEIITSFIHSKFNKEILKKFPNLKLIATRSTGIDHIDLNYCYENNITVKNVSAYGSQTIAEYTFALLLEISRKICLTSKKQKNIIGFDLNGKTLGVIGTGRIGKNVIKIAQGFGMKILIFDAFPDKKFTQENNFQYIKIEELLKKSEIISLHIPALPETKHFINDEKIKQMKNNVILINTARGSIIDSEALYKNLKNKKIKAVGLDVLELNKKKLNKKIEKLPNVLITPHNAYNSKEALDRIYQKTLENIQEFC